MLMLPKNKYKCVSTDIGCKESKKLTKVGIECDMEEVCFQAMLNKHRSNIIIGPQETMESLVLAFGFKNVIKVQPKMKKFSKSLEFFKRRFAVIFRPNSKLRPLIDDLIVRAMQSGLFEAWKAKTLRLIENTKREALQSNTKIEKDAYTHNEEHEDDWSPITLLELSSTLKSKFALLGLSQYQSDLAKVCCPKPGILRRSVRETEKKKHHSTTTMIPVEFECTPGAVGANLRDCRSFYICDKSGVWMQNQCPLGSAWNKYLKKCDDPLFVEGCEHLTTTTPRPRCQICSACPRFCEDQITPCCPEGDHQKPSGYLGQYPVKDSNSWDVFSSYKA
ncbi:hypothetical protein B4U79_17657 [Dinothrombium tinctorium]|uniref:Chitin-binding type-2 domain-containing protein n=1 Tax=Dinothrombium tinctorium TaxID=1965070 RepID=A0A3S3PBY0_9ACAR|nr:hypothetical protein B4U79_17692 [Dinothrombium tinctorium]RWS09508.1 hypothetical protein B4U79_17687 [Dinothrombium tinctorium]RWS09912.1 hypothetical protein B4U79_17657 [Dinothrombium tinctorium]